MLETGLLIVTSVVLLSLEVTLIFFMFKHFQGIHVFFEELVKKLGELNKELKEIKIQLLVDQKDQNSSNTWKNVPPAPISTQYESSKPKNQNSPTLSKKVHPASPLVKDQAPKSEIQDMISSFFQNNSEGMPIFRNLREDEIPDNLTEMKILEATQMINGKNIKINPQKVKVGNPGEMVEINLHTDKTNSHKK